MPRTLATLLLTLGWAATARGEIPVRGQVMDPKGRPVAGAEIVLVRAPTPWERMLLHLQARVDPEPEGSVKSDEEGRFELVAPEADVWKVKVAAPGYVPMSTGERPLVEQTVLEPVELVRDSPLEVRVVDGDGAPLADVWVTATSASPGAWPPSWRATWGPEPARARTDAEGRTALWRRAGELLDVTAYPPSAVLIHAPGLARGETLRAEATGVQSVRLVDRHEGPIGDAVVALGRDRWPVGRTGPDGRFEAPRHPLSETRLELALADGRRAWLTLGPGEEPPPEGWIARAEEAERLVGRVIDARTREALSGAIVSGVDPGLRTRTRADGSFELVDPRPGSRGLVAAAPGHSPEWVEELDRSVLIALPPTWAVRGVVLDAAREPIPDALVLAFPRIDGGRRFSSALGSSARAASGFDGSFDLRGLREELTYTVAAELAGVGQTEQIVQPDEAGRLIYLVLATGSTLTGQLLDETDAPVGGATLRLQESPGRDPSLAWSRALLDPRQPPNTTSAADGAFAWEHLRPGSWDLVVRVDGYAEETVTGIDLEEGRAHDLGPLRLTRGTALEGRVQDPDGAPLGGARIHVSDATPSFVTFSTGESVPDALSEADGWFSIPDRRAGDQVEIEVRREGFVARTLPGVVVADEPLLVELSPAARLTGTVLGDDGAAVAGASVVAHAEGGTAGAGGQIWAGDLLSNTVTDDQGGFELGELPSGRIELLVEATGWLPEERAGLEVGAEGDGESLTIRLRRGASVEGRVFAADGSPVSGAVVGVAAPGLRRFSGVETDADGGYRLDGVETGTRLLSASAEDGRSVSRELEVVDGINTLDLAFEAGWTVAGVVVDAAGGPVADALLTLASESTAWGGLDARADTRGSFRFENVQEGTYWLRGRHPDYAMTRLEDPVEVEGPVAGLQLRLSPGTRVVGTLYGLDETEIRQAQVIARADRSGIGEGRVSPDGGFVIPALAPDEWTVLASAPGGRKASEAVSIAPDEREIRVDLSFADGFSLTGTVLLDREPLVGARLVLRNQDIADSAWSRTDHLGRFEVRGLEPGRYGLVVSQFENGLHHQEELYLVDDEEVVIEIERHRVSGRIVDATSEGAIAGATVRLQPQAVDPALFPTSTRGSAARSDSSGAFSMGSVSGGTYELSVTKEGYSRLEHALQVGPGDPEDLVLRLEPTEGLGLRVRLADGSPARVVSVVALHPVSGTPIDGRQLLATSEGDVRLQSLPAGRWTLVVGSGDAAVAEITLTAPEDRETLQLSIGSRLEVVLPALTGPVVPAATLSLQRPQGLFFRHPGSGELRQRWSFWNGRATLDNVPAGSWIVHVEATDGRRWDETISVQPGGTQRVEID